MNHKNFLFKPIPDRNNDVIFLKSPKTLFWNIFDQLWSFLHNEDFFQKKSGTVVTGLYVDP